ncbi:maltase A3-like [Penaeus vannamei]|uniref:maltase A3-like n=1 Tax=Penaeus vannamei TaxID=6689 RepID=UPI00387F5142
MTYLGLLGPSLLLLCCGSEFYPLEWRNATRNDAPGTTGTPSTTATTTTTTKTTTQAPPTMPNWSLLDALYGPRHGTHAGGNKMTHDEGHKKHDEGHKTRHDEGHKTTHDEGHKTTRDEGHDRRHRPKANSDLVIRIPKTEASDLIVQVNVFAGDLENPLGTFMTGIHHQQRTEDEGTGNKGGEREEEEEEGDGEMGRDGGEAKEKEEGEEMEMDGEVKEKEKRDETMKTVEEEEEEEEETQTEATTNEPEIDEENKDKEEEEVEEIEEEEEEEEIEEEKEEIEEIEEEDLEELPWWKTSIVYQVYPRSFMDSTGSGVGDLIGIASRADYLRDLGVGAVWLSPVFASPMADFGYDVSNFTDIDPVFGDLRDFDDLLDELHRRGLKVILDFIPNHTSDQHEWFLKSVRREDPYTHYYVWEEPAGYNVAGDPIPPSNWLSVFRGSAWEWVEERQQFYLHQFLVEQPDLNFRNPAVREEMKDALRFWLDRGVDGFRVDALKFLFESRNVYEDEPPAQDSNVEDPLQYESLAHTLTVDQPETFEALAEWRELVDEYEDRFLMVEVYADINETMKYYGNETHPLADFPFNFQLLDSFQGRDNFTGESVMAVIDEWMTNLPEGKWPNWVIGNHDNGRVASRLGSDLVDALNMLILLLPGTPVTYYGEEIGMEDNFISWEDTQDPRGLNFGRERYKDFSRDPARTPMQWGDEPNAGFSTANATWLPVNANLTSSNVATQDEAKVSHLNIYRQLSELRREVTFVRGDLAFPQVTEEVIAILRSYRRAPSYLLVINTSEYDVTVDLQQGTTLPEVGMVVLRSVTDTSEATLPGSDVQLNKVTLCGGGGIVFKLPPV